jgi:hypothetical protein
VILYVRVLEFLEDTISHHLLRVGYGLYPVADIAKLSKGFFSLCEDLT